MFIRDIEGEVHRAADFSGFVPSQCGLYYDSSLPQYDLQYRFPRCEIDRLTAPQSAVVPCTGDYKGLLAYEAEDGSVEVSEAQVVAWRVQADGEVHPVTVPTMIFEQDISGNSVECAEAVLDVKTGKVFSVGDDFWLNLDAYKASKQEALARHRREAGKAKP